jgi:hypothetical protein
MIEMASSAGKPSHEQVAGYLTGAATRREKAAIERIRKKDKVWALFFETLEDLIRRTGVRVRVPGKPAAVGLLRYDEMERLLEDVFAGAVRRDHAQRLVDALLASPVVFRRWMGILSEVEPQKTMDAALGMAHVQMQPDGVLLRRIRSAPGCGRRASFGRSSGLISRAAGAWRGFLESIEGLSRQAKWAMAVSAVLAVASLTVISTRHQGGDGGNGLYVFDDRVPCEFDLGSFRGAVAEPVRNPEVRAWMDHIQLAVADYLLRDYETALAGFAAAERQRPKQSAGTEGNDVTRWERELSFYSGLSHLALWRTRSASLSHDLRRMHSRQAILCLVKADSIAGAANLKNNDREAYFIGLIHALQGRRAEATGWLNRIGPESPFYGKSVLLSRNGVH